MVPVEQANQPSTSCCFGTAAQPVRLHRREQFWKGRPTKSQTLGPQYGGAKNHGFIGPAQGPPQCNLICLKNVSYVATCPVFSLPPIRFQRSYAIVCLENGWSKKPPFWCPKMDPRMGAAFGFSFEFLL